MNHEQKLSPVLKWAGGKRWLVPTLRSIWKDYSNSTLVEPFCGGLAIALGLIPDDAILNDINPHLINFYSWLKKGLILSLPMNNNQEMYYKYRQDFNKLIQQKKESQKEAAEIFYYLNRTGFNGLCRFNKKGEFNTPFGRYKTINYRTDMTAYQAVLENWQFSLGDFENLNISRKSFIYADPPYDVEFRQYSVGGFEWNDQVRLAKWLAQQAVPVVVSNQATARILDLYGQLGFTVQIVSAPRRIACTGDRTPALEMFATKNL
ncbi:MAG: Dam family site-specific DNA-(adenine-N6)-methyltransferase [Snowella sp.]|nr:Dam family site-specific DNA-(adenine-N6)-methyltransferase [Snowella sp.]